MVEAPDRVPEPVNIYQIVADHLDLVPTAVVYYPCCGEDDHLRSAFPQQRVIFADQNATSIERLLAKGHEAHCVDVRTFEPVPGGADVVLVMNPTLHALEFADAVRPGGVIVCNDYHGTTKQLLRERDFELIAVVKSSRDGKRQWVDRDAQLCFQAVHNDNELATTGKLAYYQEMLDSYGADIIGESVVQRYQMLYNKYYDDGLAPIWGENGQCVFLAPLATVGGVASLAVFKKKLISTVDHQARIQSLLDILVEVIDITQEPWLYPLFQQLVETDVAGMHTEALASLLGKSTLSLRKVAILQDIVDHVCNRELMRLRFACLTDKLRVSFVHHLRLPVDPAFELPASETDLADIDIFADPAFSVLEK